MWRLLEAGRRMRAILFFLKSQQSWHLPCHAPLSSFGLKKRRCNTYSFCTHAQMCIDGVCVEDDGYQSDYYRTREKLIEPASILETQPTLHPAPRNQGLNTNSQLTALFYTVAFTANRMEEIAEKMESREEGLSWYHSCSIWRERWKLLHWLVF